MQSLLKLQKPLLSNIWQWMRSSLAQDQNSQKKRRERKKKTQERTEEEKEDFCRLPDGEAMLTFSFGFFVPPLELNHTTPEQQR